VRTFRLLRVLLSLIYRHRWRLSSSVFLRKCVFRPLNAKVNQPIRRTWSPCTCAASAFSIVVIRRCLTPLKCMTCTDNFLSPDLDEWSPSKASSLPTPQVNEPYYAIRWWIFFQFSSSHNMSRYANKRFSWIFPLWFGQYAVVSTDWSLAEQFPSIGVKVWKGIPVRSSQYRLSASILGLFSRIWFVCSCDILIGYGR